MIKKISALILSVLILFTAAGANASAGEVIDERPFEETQSLVMAQDISVNINGNTLYFPDQKPMIINDRTMVPMRVIFEALGAEVKWYPDAYAVVAEKGLISISLVIGSDVMWIDDDDITLDAVPFIENGRTMIPLRAVSEAFNAVVQWDSSSRTVTIATDGYLPSADSVPSVNNSMQQANDSQPDETVQYPEVEVLNAVNEIRAGYGLNALQWSNALAAVARAHSYDMAYSGFFDHMSQDGRSPADRIKNAGISYRRMAENIAAGQDTAASVVEAWMGAEGHRANILDPELTHLGVGLAVAEGSTYKFYWTQCFTGSAQALSAADISAMEYAVLELVNQERAAYGLAPLSWNDELAAVARAHSYDMANRNFFDHTNPDGKSPFDRIRGAGITYSIAAENIAAGQSTPEAAVAAWMNSEGHRANILRDSLTEIGIGLYVSNSGYGYYWTQDFRTPR